MIYTHISILSASIHEPSTKQYRLFRAFHDIHSILSAPIYFHASVNN